MKKGLLVLWALVGLLAMVSLVSAEEGLCRNGGFEEDPLYVAPGETHPWVQSRVEKGWDLGGEKALVIPGWVYNVSAAPAKVRLIEGTPGKEVHSGKRCLLFQAKGGGREAAMNNETSMDANQEYSLSVWAKGEGGIAVTASEYDYDLKKGPTFLGNNRVLSATLSDDWKEYQAVIKKANPNAKTFSIMLVSNDEAYFDDVVVVEKKK